MKENWKNNRTWPVAFLRITFLLMLGLAACSPEKSHEHAEGEVYTCPMHPQVVKNEPGSCPICGMDLVKKGGAASGDTVQTQLGDLLKPVNQVVVSSLRTVHPQAGAKELTLQLPGRVEYDTRRVSVIASRFAGRIEKLYVRYNYQPVSKGQKLFDIYSPEMVTAQQELIFLLTSDPDNTRLIGAARQKLSLLGLSTAQINRVAATRKPQYELSVYSPASGFIIESSAPVTPAMQGAAGATAASGDGMNGMAGGNTPSSGPQVAVSSPAASANTPVSLTEGAYISAGQSVFRVVNTDKVWAVFQSYPESLARLRKGQLIQITVENNPSQVIKGQVNLIEPFYRNGQNTATIRVFLNNLGGRLRTGNLLTGGIEIKSDSTLWLPRAAVLDLGNRRVVFIKEAASLRPQTVQTGLQSGEWIEVRKGISPDDAVADNAQYLLDSEAFVKEESRDEN